MIFRNTFIYHHAINRRHLVILYENKGKKSHFFFNLCKKKRVMNDSVLYLRKGLANANKFKTHAILSVPVFDPILDGVLRGTRNRKREREGER